VNQWEVHGSQNLSNETGSLRVIFKSRVNEKIHKALTGADPKGRVGNEAEAGQK
jgi:hypothetical protein